MNKIAADNVLSGALRQLFAVAEAYPDLKANANFAQLQSSLEDTENKISYARQSYNDCVLNYNNAIQTFPGNIFAGVFQFKERSGLKPPRLRARRPRSSSNAHENPGRPFAASLRKGAFLHRQLTQTVPKPHPATPNGLHMNKQQLEPHTTADQPEPRPTPQARPQAAQAAQAAHHASRPHASQTRPTAQARRYAQTGHRPKTEHARAKAVKAPKEKPQGGRSRYLPALDDPRAGGCCRGSVPP